MNIFALWIIGTAQYAFANAIAYHGIDNNYRSEACWDGVNVKAKELGRDQFIAGSLEDANIEVTLNGQIFKPDIVSELMVGEINNIELRSTVCFFRGYEVRVHSLFQGHFQLLPVGTTTTTGTSILSSCSGDKGAAIAVVDKDFLMDHASILVLIESGQEDISIEISTLMQNHHTGGDKELPPESWYSTIFDNNYITEKNRESARFLQFYNETFEPTSTFFPVNETAQPTIPFTLFPTPGPTIAPTEQPTITPTFFSTPLPSMINDTNVNSTNTFQPTFGPLPNPLPSPTTNKPKSSTGAIVGSVFAALFIVAALTASLIFWKRRKSASEGGNAVSETPSATKAAQLPNTEYAEDPLDPDAVSQPVNTVIASLINPNVNPDLEAGEYRPTVKDQCRTVVPDPLASPAAASLPEHLLVYARNDQLANVAAARKAVPATASSRSRNPKSAAKSPNVPGAASLGSRSSVEPLFVTAQVVDDDEDDEDNEEEVDPSTIAKRKAIDP